MSASGAVKFHGWTLFLLGSLLSVMRRLHVWLLSIFITSLDLPTYFTDCDLATNVGLRSSITSDLDFKYDPTVDPFRKLGLVLSSIVPIPRPRIVFDDLSAMPLISVSCLVRFMAFLILFGEFFDWSWAYKASNILAPSDL